MRLQTITEVNDGWTKITCARLTPSEAREEFIDRATDLWDSINTWYRDHPEATFDEIEKQIVSLLGVVDVRYR